MSMRLLSLPALAALAAATAIALADAPAGSHADAKQLVDSKGCGLCHKSGGLAKPLSAYAGGDPDRIRGAILDPKKTLGASTMMPAFQGKLTDAETDALVAFIKAGGS